MRRFFYISTMLVYIFPVLFAFQFFPPQPLASEKRGSDPEEIKQPVSVAVLNNFPPFSFEVRGKVMGFTIDYLDLVSGKYGIEFTYHPGTWEENLRKFKNNEIDVITAISHTEEREAFTRYTTPYYRIPTVVYTRENSFSYKGVKTLKDRRVGIEAGIYYKPYLQKYPDIRIVEVEDTNELMKKLSFGEVEAVVTNINIGNYMIKQHMLENVELAGKIDIPAIATEDLRIGVRREKKNLHEIIQDGINSISVNEYKNLQDRWVGFTPEKIQNTLMPKDRQVVEKHTEENGGLRLSFHKRWYPVDFLNKENDHSGISEQIFDMVSEKYDISLLEQPAGDFEQAVESVLKGDSGVLPAIVPTSRLRKQLTFTKPYLSLPLVIATRSEEFFVGNLDKLSGKQIGIIDRGSILGRFQNNYPSLDFNPADSVKQGLNRVEQEQDFAFVGTIPSIAYAIKNHNFFNIKISGKLEETLSVSAAVRNGNDDLAAVLDKMLQSIPIQKREEAIDRWISISIEEKVDYSLVWQISAISLFIIALVVIWLRKVHAYNSEISKAYELLEDKNRQLEQLSITDPLTGLYNRNRLDTALEYEKGRSVRYNDIFSLVMIDIDNFKSLNDRFGHQIGDAALQQTGELIRNSVRFSDIPGRWGGEEFLIICPETYLEGASGLAERIRLEAASQIFPESITLTVSAGAAEYKNGEDRETLVKRVDDLLYKAKRAGKNQVCS